MKHDLLVIDLQGDKAAELIPFLTSWSLCDGEGLTADRASLTFESEQALKHIPSSGAEWRILIDGEHRGHFQVSTIDEHLEPEKLVMQLTPAKFDVADKTRWRETRKRTFPPATVGDVVRSVMQAHGYEVRVDEALDALPTDHLNQNEETDRAFINRLASKFDAIAKPVDRLFVFGKRGNLSTLSGNPKQPITITPADVKKGSLKISHPSNVRYSGVKVEWQTPESGESDTVTIGAEPFHRIKEVCKNADEATQRAEAKLSELTRKGQGLTVTLRGKPGFFAEAVLIASGFKSPRAGGEWSIDNVRLSGSRTQYEISLDATRPV